MPPPAEFLGDLPDPPVGVGGLDLRPANVREVEEAREWPLRGVGVPQGLLADVLVLGVVIPRLGVLVDPMLLLFVPLGHARLSALEATQVTGEPDALVLGPLVQPQIVRGRAHVLAHLTVVRVSGVLGHLVPLKAAQLRELEGAEVAVESLAALGRSIGQLDALVLCHLVPTQTALLSGHILALVTGVFLGVVLGERDDSVLTAIEPCDNKPQ